MSNILLLLLSRFFHFFLPRIIIYKYKTVTMSFKREIIITSLFKKPLTKILTNNFKIDIKGISGRLEMCKNIVSA